MQDYLKFQWNMTDERTVSAYDELPLWSAMFGLFLLDHLELRPNLQVLDVGCGSGFPLLELAQRLGPTCTLYGIDLWETGIARAREKMDVYGVKNVEIRTANASSMPFPDGKFGLIISNLGINNFEDPDAVFAECYRVMKPSATIALTTNVIGHMKEFYELFKSTLSEEGNPEMLKALKKHIQHRASIEKVQAMLERNKFKMTRALEQSGSMRFLDGTSLLNHYFIKLGFLDGWKEVVDAKDQERIFSALENNLNQVSKDQGGLDLTIPMAYIEGKRIP
jgi:ubiquinone/menaquinone biosynthesis C-methylase UbiE